MNKSSADFESELRVSPKPVLATLPILGALLLLGAQLLSCPWTVASQTISLFLVLCLLSLIGWLTVEWKPLMGRWFVVLSLVVVVYAAHVWLDVAESLAFVVIPIALAVPLISLRAAAITAVGESLFLTVVLNYLAVELDPLSVAVALIAIWGMLGVMYAAYRPMHKLIGWLEGYFEHTQHLLSEARDRQMELRQALESLANANRQLALANERMAQLRVIAEEAQRAKTSFVASVSHEFRTPLNLIIGLVDLMLEAPEIYAVALSPKMRADLEVVHRNCEHLANMIDDVLNLTRLETGRMALHRERVDLREAINRSAAAVHPLLVSKQLALRIVVPDDLPEVYCDRTRIQQVILNLLSNAARFTDEGGIEIETAQQDQHVLVSVTDTGQGISQEDAARIFEPFWQGAGQLWRDKGGSGLGLSISRQFVKLHGGQMWLESELGVGTTFSFTLPISPPLEHAAHPAYKIREDWVWREHAFRTGRAGHGGQLVKPRVVVCDKTGTLYPLFVHYSDQVEFIDTQGLAQAIQEIRECPVQAVVLNTAVSDTLWSLVETTRRDVPGTPIIGCSIPPRVERAIDVGALGYLIKPVTRADLERAIRAVATPVRRVLIVDDDLNVLQLYSRMLHVFDSTLEIVTASSGKEALEELRRTCPDLMLLDIVMPDMDGWQVMESMAADERTRNVPTFFVSAQDPTDELPMSELLLITMHGGLSLSALLRCSLEISALLLEPEKGLDLVPV
jgi:signal transduction histidine kinase/CheY-like chemotaxis protein